MKQIKLLLFILIFLSYKSFATEQVLDLLIYNNDTLLIYTDPLDKIATKRYLNNMFGSREDCALTSCYKGYQATWIIEENSLFLTGIYSCCFKEDSIQADLKILFRKKFINGKVKADWFSGIIVSPQGNILRTKYIYGVTIYEKEITYKFKKGKLIGSEIKDNTKKFETEESE